MTKIRRALLSVSDKQDLPTLARALRQHDVEIISSGGTAALLRQEGIEVITVSAYTGADEILGGRVKTLHPRIFAGILARPSEEHRAQLVEQAIGEIDLVVVNLYPFEATIARGDAPWAEAIETIDIGGPSLLRAAAKNHERVAVAVDPADYPALIAELDENQGSIQPATRRRLAGRAFAHTAKYDAAIAAYFQQAAPGDARFPEVMPLALCKVADLRYGENPHQQAAFYAAADARGVVIENSYEQLGGKALSYNNILDIDGAWSLVADLPRTACCVIKHTNPCGAAFIEGGDAAEVFLRAKQGDPLSAFGGIVSCNVTITEAMAMHLKEMFLEAIVAPNFDPAALAALKKKKKLRLLKRVGQADPSLQIRSAAGGILVQEADRSLEDVFRAEVVSRRKPHPRELADLDFAWRVCKHVKSNAIVFCKDGQLVGVGAGQMSRVDAVKLAAERAVLPKAGAVLASDAFFPFRDGLDVAVEAGVVAVVQPGGSIRDEEVIAAADERDVAMVFTGARHFRH